MAARHRPERASRLGQEGQDRDAGPGEARRLPLDLATEDGYERVEERLSPRDALADAVGLLADHEREALDLHVVDELPYPEVAERLDIRPAAARLRVSRALRRLATAMQEEEL